MMSSLHYQTAIALYQQGKLLKAVAQLKKDKSDSFNVQKLNLQIHYDLKKYAMAVTIGKQLLQKKIAEIEKKEISFFVGICLSQLNKKSEAVSFLEHCVAIDNSINNASALYNLLCLYYQQDQLIKVEKLATKMLSWDQYFVKVTYILAQCAAKTDKKALLQKRAKELAKYSSQLSEEMFGEVTNFLTSTGLYSDSAQLIGELEQKGDFEATSLRAELMLAKKEYQEITDYLSKEKLSRLKLAKLYYIKGTALDKLQRYDEAFIEFEQAAKLQKAANTKLQAKGYLPLWNKLVDKSLAQDAKWHQFASESNENFSNIAFIFGFPRSGTTLLDNILDTQKDVLVLSEKGAIYHVIEAFSQLNKKYPQDVIELTSTNLCFLRSIYFKSIQNKGYTISENGLIVDKGPHHTETVPLLVKLFPNAKLIASIRHPVDVCLSCFQQNFEFNQYNAFLVTMADVTKRYNQVFTLLERYKNELGVEVKSVKYEDLVTDFDEVMMDLFDYLGLEVDEAYKNFHQHAASKYVTSASRGQTDKALYKTSTFRWKNYKKQLTPYIEPLQYFIDKYGYKT